MKIAAHLLLFLSASLTGLVSGALLADESVEKEPRAQDEELEANPYASHFVPGASYPAATLEGGLFTPRLEDIDEVRLREKSMGELVHLLRATDPTARSAALGLAGDPPIWDGFLRRRWLFLTNPDGYTDLDRYEEELRWGARSLVQREIRNRITAGQLTDDDWRDFLIGADVIRPQWTSRTKESWEFTVVPPRWLGSILVEVQLLSTGTTCASGRCTLGLGDAALDVLGFGDATRECSEQFAPIHVGTPCVSTAVSVAQSSFQADAGSTWCGTGLLERIAAEASAWTRVHPSRGLWQGRLDIPAEAVMASGIRQCEPVPTGS